MLFATAAFDFRQLFGKNPATQILIKHRGKLASAGPTAGPDSRAGDIKNFVESFCAIADGGLDSLFRDTIAKANDFGLGAESFAVWVASSIEGTHVGISPSE